MGLCGHAAGAVSPSSFVFRRGGPREGCPVGHRHDRNPAGITRSTVLVLCNGKIEGNCVAPASRNREIICRHHAPCRYERGAGAGKVAGKFAKMRIMQRFFRNSGTPYTGLRKEKLSVAFFYDFGSGEKTPFCSLFLRFRREIPLDPFFS